MTLKSTDNSARLCTENPVKGNIIAIGAQSVKQDYVIPFWGTKILLRMGHGEGVTYSAAAVAAPQGVQSDDIHAPIVYPFTQFGPNVQLLGLLGRISTLL
mgnify:CR=1 FL=1